MGKWSGIGFVLINAHHHPVSDLPTLTSGIFAPRGTSSEPNCANAYLMWKAVVANLVNIDKRQVHVIEAQKLKPVECWGVGLMIFAPKCWTEGAAGLKNRFLPLLHDASVEKVRLIKKPNWSKKNNVNW